MNDEPGSISTEPTWDSFEDVGPSIQEDSAFRARFALSPVRYGDTDARVERTDTPFEPEASPVAPATQDIEVIPGVVRDADVHRTTSAPTKVATSSVHEVESVAPPEIEGVSSTPPLVEAKSEGVQTEPHPATITEFENGTPQPNGVGVIGEPASTPKAMDPIDKRKTVDSGSTVDGVVGSVPISEEGSPEDEKFEGEPHSGAEDAVADWDLEALSRAVTLVSLAANEWMKELAEQEQRREPRPLALVDAETFPEAVEAAFDAPAPGLHREDIPTPIAEGEPVREASAAQAAASSDTQGAEGFDLSDQESGWFRDS